MGKERIMQCCSPWTYLTNGRSRRLHSGDHDPACRNASSHHLPPRVGACKLFNSWNFNSQKSYDREKIILCCIFQEWEKITLGTSTGKDSCKGMVITSRQRGESSMTQNALIGALTKTLKLCTLKFTVRWLPVELPWSLIHPCGWTRLEILSIMKS